VHQDAWMMAYNRDLVIGGWAGNTGANGAGNTGVNGAGNTISAFGVNTGSTMLADFINTLPAGLNHWYQQPAGLTAKNGELFLPGTENLATGCGRTDGGGGGGGGGDGGAGRKKKH